MTSGIDKLIEVFDKFHINRIKFIFSDDLSLDEITAVISVIAAILEE